MVAEIVIEGEDEREIVEGSRAVAVHKQNHALGVFRLKDICAKGNAVKRLDLDLTEILGKIPFLSFLDLIQIGLKRDGEGGGVNTGIFLLLSFQRAEEKLGNDKECKDQPERDCGDQNVKYPMHNKNPFRKRKLYYQYSTGFSVLQDKCPEK
jgi:hypothetical protein